ncbi:MAG TPA: diphthamide biosynthesis enzyme Dph2, partial [Methanocorpusculum sp.]|nr:diphthamide biosynthesis enzyme Dph2 [Methanocorpusculum sp.]
PFKQDINLDIFESSIQELKKVGTVGIITTAQHVHQIQDVLKYLKSHGVSAVVSTKTSIRTPHSGQVLGCTYTAATSIDTDAYLFIGTGLFHAIGVSIATSKPTFAIDPYGSGTLIDVSNDRLLRKRFVQIEKAKSAKNFGILLSSKSGQCRKELADRLVKLTPNASIILIREISEMQLINLGYDAYVNTACPRLSIDDQIRYPMPILSPYEFEILLGLRSWDDYKIDEIEL